MEKKRQEGQSPGVDRRGAEPYFSIGILMPFALAQAMASG